MSEPLDLATIDPGWLRSCGYCDLGAPTNCTCPTGDPRIVISQLAAEVDRVRALTMSAVRRHVAATEEVERLRADRDQRDREQRAAAWEEGRRALAVYLAEVEGWCRNKVSATHPTYPANPYSESHPDA